jgi:hypothetical protein
MADVKDTVRTVLVTLVTTGLFTTLLSWVPPVFGRFQSLFFPSGTILLFREDVACKNLGWQLSGRHVFGILDGTDDLATAAGLEVGANPTPYDKGQANFFVYACLKE